MGKTATLNSEIVATIIGLKKTGHRTKEMVELTGVCERSLRNYVGRFNKERGVNTPCQNRSQVGSKDKPKG